MLPQSSVRFCISTCNKFAAHTLKTIIPSLTRAGIGTNEILIVNGGQEDWRIDHYGDVPMICTPQNSFEYTPLIEIVEHNLTSPFWFCFTTHVLLDQHLKALSTIRQKLLKRWQ